MSYKPADLLQLLKREFEFDESRAFEFGWCNILEAEDRDYRRPVWIYYPLAEVWDNSQARKSLTRMFTDYDQMEVHECLPQSIEVLTGKKAAGGIALITHRVVDANVTAAEREGTGVNWLTQDTFSLPDKMGAALRFVNAFGLLHDFGLTHGAIGHQTISIRRKTEKPLIKVDFINFSEVGEKMPKPSLFFEPAFSAPELFPTQGGEEEPHYTKKSDVYGLAKYILYVLLGPKNFIEYFSPSEGDEVAPADEMTILSQLFDHVLWANLAQRQPDLEVSRLDQLGGEKIHTSLAEILCRSVAFELEPRPEDAPTFYHGLRSVMAGVMGGANVDPGAVPPPPGGGYQRPQPKSSGPNYLGIGAAVVAVIALLGGGWYYMNEQAKQKRLDELMAAANEACGGFVTTMDGLQDSTIKGLKRWSDVERLRERINANGQDPAKLEETLGFCRTGNERLGALRSELIEKLKTQVTDETNYAQQNGTDLTSVEVEEKLDIVAAFEQNRDFPGTEGTLLGLVSDIVLAHDEIQNSRLDIAQQEILVAQQIMGAAELPEALTVLMEQISTSRSGNASSEALKAKDVLIEDAREARTKALRQAGGARRETVEGLIEYLLNAGAGNVATGFAELQSQFSGLAQPNTMSELGEFQQNFVALDRISSSMGFLRQEAEQKASELPGLEEQMKTRVDLIRDLGWAEEGDIKPLLDEFKSWRDSTIFEDHLFLTNLRDSMEDEIAPLELEWEEGRQVCRDMFQQATSTAGLDGTTAWQGISRIMSEVRNFDSNRATREDFARCADAFGLIAKGRIELRTNDLLTEMRDAREALEDKGVGDFIDVFAQAVAEYDILLGLEVPGDDAAYAVRADRVFEVIARFDEAEEIFEEAARNNKSLTADMLKLEARIEADPKLSVHPARIELAGTLEPVDLGHVLERNAALEGNIALLSELVRAFEAGELLACNFNGVEMSPVVLSPEAAAEAVKLMKDAAASSDIPELSVVAPVDRTSFCLSSNPVSVADLSAFRETLRTRQQDVRTEIDVTQDGGDGAAVNISFWLAQRYAEHVGEGADMTVCVAPSIATVWAGTSGGENFSTSGEGEMSSGNCNDESPVPQKFALIGGSKAECVNVNTRQPKLTFRLAAGDVCN